MITAERRDAFHTGVNPLQIARHFGIYQTNAKEEALAMH